MLIAVAIAVLIIGTTAPFTLEFYQRSELHTEQRNIVAYLILARSRAMANKNQMSQGLYLDNSNATIFQGPSYANRNPVEDLILPRSKIVGVSDASEIIFTQLSGTTTAATTTLRVGQAIRYVVINPEGLIQ